MNLRPIVIPIVIVVALLLFSSVAMAGDINIVAIGSDNAALSDAIVYLVPRQNASLPNSPSTAKIDQVNREFVPLVSAMRTGTSVYFPNSDNIRHHVYSFSPAKVFDLKLYSGRPSTPVVFDKPGIVTLGCNIHDQMIAWILVVDTPWFAKTDANGHAAIANLPEGEYTLHAWHPGAEAEPATQSINIAGAAPIVRTVRIAAKPVAQLRREVSASGAQ